MDNLDRFLKISEYASTLDGVIALLKGGSLDEMLDLIGDIHYEFALVALEDAAISNRPEDEINRAISSLVTARISYLKRTEGIGGLLRAMSSIGTGFFFPFDFGHVDIYRKACMCSLTIAICNKALHKEQLVKKYANYAAKDFIDYKNEVDENSRYVGGHPSMGSSGLADTGLMTEKARKILDKQKQKIEKIIREIINDSN